MEKEFNEKTNTVSHGVTFSRVCKVAFHRWPIFLAVMLGITVVGSIGFNFIYNNRVEVYSCTFSYSSPDLSKEVYADNSNFKGSSLVSKEVLDAVKNSKEEYKNIDIEKIILSGSTSAKTTYIVTADDTKSAEYTINIPKKYFSSYEQGKAFLTDLASSAIVKDSQIVNNGSYDASLKKFDTATSFESQLSYLSNQTDDLLTSYEDLLKLSKNASITSIINANIQTILSLTNRSKTTSNTTITSTSNNDIFYSLQFRIDKYGLVKDRNAAEFKNLPSQKVSLETEKAYNEQVIADIKTNLSGLAGIELTESLNRVAELSERNTKISKDMAVIDLKLGPENVEETTKFSTDLTNLRNSLEDCVTEYKNTLNKTLIEDSSVVYSSSREVITKGGLDVALSIIISLLVGFVVAFIVNLIIDRKELKNPNKIK